MGAQENGLATQVQELAHKLEAMQRESTARMEALERENEQMRSENTELRYEVSALRASGTRRERLDEMRGSETRLDAEPVSALEGRVSRRSLLSKAGAAAVAAVAAGTLLNTRQAKAHVTTTDVHADEVFAHILWAESHDLWTPIVSKASNTTEAIRGSNENSGSGVKGYSRSGSGVVGITDAGRFTGDPPAADQAGVEGDGPTGVLGRSSNDSQAAVKGVGSTGVWGLSSKTGYSGVYGEHTGISGHGTVGIGKGEAHAGVLGRNSDGTGVHGQSSKTGYGGVTAEHTGSAGYGVIGLGTGATGAGVLGRNNSGYGGQFEGGRAQLKLKPGSSAGKPGGAHAKGEIYMDSAGTLFVCVRGGNPATWKRVSATAV